MRSIAILGGGISGLATLHFFKKRLPNDLDITLYEAKSVLGGNIRSHSEDGFLFETGPNGFIDSSPVTLELVNDLGLNDEIITADLHAKRRYIKLDGKLNQLPTSLGSFLQTPILTTQEKIEFNWGIF